MGETGNVLACQTHPEQDMHFQTPAPRWQGTVKLVEKTWLSPTVLGVTVKAPAPIAYQAGQYAQFVEADGRRSFSIANAPSADGLLRFQLKANGRFAQRLAALPLKTLMTLEAPFGAFTYQADSRPALLLAGGTGIAPILALIEAHPELRTSTLFWGVDNEEEAYLSFAAFPDLHVVKVFSGGDQPQFIHQVLPQQGLDLSQHVAYAAGPPLMIQSLENLPLAALHYDRFG